MSDARPIGVLDSGIGGLSIVREISRLMPGERIIYFGDTARYPYGNRSDDVIRTYTMQCVEQLMKHDIKVLVVGCNTMAACALETIEREIHDIPIIGGIAPGARAAVFRTADKKIGVIGTHAAIHSHSYQKAIHHIDASVKVFETPTPLLLPLLEELMFDHDITRLTTQFYLYEMIDVGVDCLILGCTPYTSLLEVIQGTVGTRMQLLDTALWTAKEVEDILTALDLRSENMKHDREKSTFLITEEVARDTRLIPVLFGGALPSIETVTLTKGST